MIKEIKMFHDTMKTIRTGSYVSNGTQRSLILSQDQMNCAKVYLPDAIPGLIGQSTANGSNSEKQGIFSVNNLDSFSAARKILKENSIDHKKDKVPEVLVLNFANAVSPGGGVTRGARAQEEDLCRKSTLYVSLKSSEASCYYTYNRKHYSNMGTDSMVLSPYVEVFKDEKGNYLQESAVVSVLSCAAPMVLFGKWTSMKRYREILYRRICAIIKCAVVNGYKFLVLGAWGCGDFGNDPKLISDLFYDAFQTIGTSDFEIVEFAVLCKSERSRNFTAFSERFG